MTPKKIGDKINRFAHITEIHKTYYLVTNGHSTWIVPKPKEVSNA